MKPPYCKAPEVAPDAHRVVLADPPDGVPCTCGERRLGPSTVEVERLSDRIVHRRDRCQGPAGNAGSEVEL